LVSGRHFGVVHWAGCVSGDATDHWASCGSNWSLAKEYSRRVNLVTDLKELEQILETGIQRASGDNRGNQKSALKESKREQTSAENRQTSGTGVNCLLCVLSSPPLRTLLLGAYMLWVQLGNWSLIY